MAQKFLVSVDLSKNELQNARIQNLGSAPGTPVEGQVYHDTTAHATYIYNGTTWVPADASKLSGTIPNAALVNSSVTIGTTSTALGATSASLAGLQGLASATGAYAFDWSTSTSTFKTSSGANTFNGDVTISGSKQFTTGTGAVALNGDVTVASGKTLTLAQDPTLPLHAATKQYVDNSAQGLDSKASVVVATTANIANLLTGAPNTVDGVSLTIGDRVLVKDQSTQSGNGIYTVTTVGTGANGVWARAADADAWSELPSAYVWVESGSTQSDTGWTCTVNSGGTLGSTAVTWVLFASAGSLIAGNGLTKTGNQIDVVSHAGSASTIGTLNISADAVGVNLGTSSTTAAAGDHTHANMALTTGNLSQFAATTSAQLLGVISDETGSGALVFATSPTLVTPVLGVATATTINKVTITQPATSAVLTIANGKTLTASNTLTFTGTDSSSVAFGTGGTVVYTSNNLSVLAATTSAQLAGVISDETGSGVLVFGTSPTITTSLIAGSASFDLINTVATTVNFAGAATSLTIGKVGGGTTINGSVTLAGHATAGFVKTNGSGVVSIDTATYLTSGSQSTDFKILSIDNTDIEYTWVATDATAATASAVGDTAKIVAAKTGSTYGIQVVADATLKAIGIRHADTSSQASVDNSANSQFIKSIVLDEFGHITSVTSGAPAGSLAKYSTSIGDGSSVAIVVTHNLGTMDVQVEVYDNTTPWARVFTDVEHTSTNTITIRFAVAPTSNQYRVVVVG